MREKPQSKNLGLKTLGVVSVGPGLAAVALTLVEAMTSRYEHYGLALFVGLPMVWGYAVAYWDSRLTRPKYYFLAVVLVQFVGVAFFLLLFQIEGLLCVLMVMPLYLPLLVIGWAIGRLCFGTISRRRAGIAVLFLVEPGQ